MSARVDQIAELQDVDVVTNPAYGRAAVIESPLTHRASRRTNPGGHRATIPSPARRSSTVAPAVAPPAAPENRSTPTPTRRRIYGLEEPLGRAVVEADRGANGRAMRAIKPGENRALTEPSLSLVAPPELSTFLWDVLRPQSVVLESGVQVIVTDRQTVEWPRTLTDPTAAFYDEIDAITESDPTFDTITATPKAIKALVRGSSKGSRTRAQTC